MPSRNVSADAFAATSSTSSRKSGLSDMGGHSLKPLRIGEPLVDLHDI